MSYNRIAETGAIPAGVSERGIDWESLVSELKHRAKQSIRLYMETKMKSVEAMKKLKV